MSQIEKQCSFGHYFTVDAADDEDCPYCAQQKTGYKPRKTMPIYLDEAASTNQSTSSLGSTDGTPFKPEGNLPRNKTVAVYDTDVSEPVAGWLVVTVGPLRGQDFKVPVGRSSFGRDASCRIVIAGDPTVSSQQGYINYSRNRRFTLSPGEGSALLYVNGAEVLVPQELQAYDVIEMGSTKMAFIPFCGSRFDWSGETS
jgi:hypothetical protein